MVAAIFDMDGLLLDTEPLWCVSMLRVAEKHSVNIRSDFFSYTSGLRINEVTAFWQHKFGWKSNIHSDGLAEEIVEDIITLSMEQGRVMPGIVALLDELKQAKVKIGVATSSPQYMMDTLLQHFHLAPYFDVTVSAEHEHYGKPHPAVYLKAAQILNANPWQCLAFEDSLNGVIAAKSARMQVVAVPDENNVNNPKFAIADAVVSSLEGFSLKNIEQLIKI